MEETIGWLLPLLIAASAVRVIFPSSDQQPARTSCLIAIGILMTAAGGRLLLHPEMHWDGPSIFALDSFHRLTGGLRLTAAQLPLLWLAWWWMSEESPISSENATRDRSRRQAALSCLLLMLLADDVWLWFGSLAAFSLFQQSLVSRGVSGDFRLTALRSCHWLGVLLLLISVGILSFDFKLHHFSELSSALEGWDSFSHPNQAELTLATNFASWSVLLTAAVFPVSVLRIDRHDASGCGILSVLVAGAVCLTFAPLISRLNVTAAHRSLLLMTVIISAVCSWQQPTLRKTTRCIGVALLMLGLMGLLQSGPAERIGSIRTFGLETLSLAILIWQLWDREPVSRRSEVLSCSLAVLLVAGLVPWPEFLVSVSETENPTALRPELPCLIAAALSFGLTKVVASSLRSEHPVHELVSESPGFFATHRTSIALAIAVLITFTNRWMLFGAGLPALARPSLAVVGGVLLGAAGAVFMLRRQTKLDVSSSFARLLESQFHLVSIWDGVVRLPAMVLSTAVSLWDIWRLRSSGRRSGEAHSASHNPPFVWELGLGLASLFVLSWLFLWMGE